ncbi:oxygen-regulated invasion protein OrgB [Chromobacterium phragmitis]|uniref:Oxygen-regulated invasion protein OrgB n=1 Tax=Chromobacterium phragmitis TaxID=2202141 RepID=A0ABV0IPH1_9NEIS|nr:oxygen-regulated invasion protein OrgB [Chromobacterium phragmitis]
MPKDIPIFRPPAAIEGVLIPRERLWRQNQALGLEQAARRHAARIVREAERQADSLREQARRDGYAQGMREAMSHVANYLSDGDDLLRRFRGILDAEARRMLAAAVDHPEALLLALDEWLRERRGEEAEQTLYLRLPRSAGIAHAQLMSLLAESWQGRLDVEYHDDARFLMRCGELAADFDPARYVDEGVQLLQSGLDALPEDCRALSKIATACLREAEEGLSAKHSEIEPC